jgi:hypothetical protein
MSCPALARMKGIGPAPRQPVQRPVRHLLELARGWPVQDDIEDAAEAGDGAQASSCGLFEHQEVSRPSQRYRASPHTVVPDTRRFAGRPRCRPQWKAGI